MANYCSECGRVNEVARTIMNIVVDASGSMYGLTDDTIGGINRYLDDIRKQSKEDGGDVLVTMTFFNTNSWVAHENMPISDVPELTRSGYAPSGGTALYDAIETTLKATERVASKSDKVITVIMTDGAENSSRTATKQSVKNRVETLTGRGNHTFVYLGAGIDAMADGGGIGIYGANTYSYVKDSANTTATFGGLTRGTQSFRSGTAMASADFSSLAGFNDTTGTAPAPFQAKTTGPNCSCTVEQKNACSLPGCQGFGISVSSPTPLWTPENAPETTTTS